MQTFHPALKDITPAEVTAAMANFAKEPTAAPPWLAQYAPGALIGFPTHSMFEAQRERLAAAIQELTGVLGNPSPPNPSPPPSLSFVSHKACM